MQVRALYRAALRLLKSIRVEFHLSLKLEIGSKRRS